MKRLLNALGCGLKLSPNIEVSGLKNLKNGELKDVFATV
jgi:hypothetical protein